MIAARLSRIVIGQILLVSLVATVPGPSHAQVKPASTSAPPKAGTGTAVPTRSGPGRAAAAQFKKAEAAYKLKQYKAAIAGFVRAIELDPDYAEAHARLTSIVQEHGEGDEAARLSWLEKQYESWAAKHPDRAIFPATIGRTLYYADPAKAERYSRRAVEIDPAYSTAWHQLSLLADIRGENREAAEHLRRAHEAKPDDPAFLFYYARALAKVDPDASLEMQLSVPERFPTDERGAQALYWLGVDASSRDEKVAYLERLRRQYAPAKFRWAENGTESLYEMYSLDDPSKALALAREMVKALPAKGARPKWETRLALEETLAEARTLLAGGRPKDALARLKRVKTVPREAQTPFLLVKWEAAIAAGDLQPTYDDILSKVAREPKPRWVEALGRLARALHKADTQVSAELAALREKNATPAADFTLERSDGSGTASLADYRGKVVLLNFWFPT